MSTETSDPSASTPSMEDSGPPLQVIDPWQYIQDLQQQVSFLSKALETFQASLKPPAPVIHLPSKPSLKYPTPAFFDGSMDKTETFLYQLAQYFEGNKVTDDASKVSFALSLMREGTAGQWVLKMDKERNSASELPAWVNDWDIFLMHFRRIFKDPNPSSTAVFKLNQLKQKSMTAVEYNTAFQLIMGDTGYNDAALIEKYKAGLNSALVEKIYSLPEMPTTIQGWCDWAARFDLQWRQRQKEKEQEKASTHSTTTFKPKPSSTSSAPPATTSLTPPTHQAPAPRQSFPIPMEVDSAWKRAPTRQVICYKCRKPGHMAAKCFSTINLHSMDYNALQDYFYQKLSAEHSASPTVPTVPSSTPTSTSTPSTTTSVSQKDFT